MEKVPKCSFNKKGTIPEIVQGRYPGILRAGYSALRLLTGLETAALKDCMPTVIQAISIVEAIATAKSISPNEVL